MTGTLAFIGGAQFGTDTSHHDDLFARGSEVLLLPTAKAYEDPGAEVSRAQAHFDQLGVSVRVLPVYTRADALDPDIVEHATTSGALYVSGGSPMHLRSVLKDSPLLDALVRQWRTGTTVALAAESCPVLCSHMVDTRGGAFTVGLGLVTTMTVIPRFDTWSHDKRQRTIGLASEDLVVVGIDEVTALVRAPDGRWTEAGSGGVHVFEAGASRAFDDLPTELSSTGPA